MRVTRMNKTLVAFFALGIIAGDAAAGDQASLQSVLAAARQNNPEILSAAQAYRAADKGIASQSAWGNPRMGYEFMQDAGRLYLSQEFSFPGKRSSQRTAATSMAAAAQQELHQKTVEIEAKTKKAYWGYWLAFKDMEIYDENILLMQRILEIAKSKYRTGAVTETDVLAANAELGRMQGMRVMAAYDRDAMRAELNALMNRGPDEPLGDPASPDASGAAIDYPRLETKTLQNNFLIAEKQYRYQGSAADAQYARRAWFPDLMAEAWISEDAARSAFMASVQVPLYFWNRVSDVQSKTALVAAAEERLASEKNAVRLALKDMYLRYDRDLTLITIYEATILPSSRQAVQISESGYRAGKLDFLYLLDLQKKHLEFELAYNKLTAESRMYFAELEMLAGGALP